MKTAEIINAIIDDRDALRAERNELLLTRKWQLIETAPKDGTRFLAFFPYIVPKPNSQGVVLVIRRHNPGGQARNPHHHYETWVSDDGSTLMSPRPSHWMPLPAPPEETP